MLLISLLLSSLVSGLKVVPQPNGPYGVSLTDLQFTDTSRIDPATGKAPRTIPVSLITPIGPSTECQPVQQMYMPEPTAKYWDSYYGSLYGLSLNNTFTQVALSLCKPVHTNEQYPLIFFSPGSQTSRQFYNIIASNIAAQGFTLITLDTPGETQFITYLNGTTELGVANFTTDAQQAAGVYTRYLDIEYVLQSLSTETSESWQQNCNLNTTNPSIMGHSFGGDTALNTVVLDERFIGGVNLDGGVHGAPLTDTTERPILLMTSDDPLYPHNLSTVPSWWPVWQHELGPKWQIQVLNSTHDSYTDVPVLGSLFGLYKLPGINILLGNITSQEMLEIEVSVMSTFAKYLYGQESIESVIQNATSFEEVRIVNATDVGED